MSYFHCVLAPKNREVLLVEAQNRLKTLQFDTIAVRGVSGISFGAILADRMQKNLIIIRKPDEWSHDRNRVVAEQCTDQEFAYIIVDDFILSGHTVETIHDEVENRYPRAVCKGIYCYRQETATKFNGIRKLHRTAVLTSVAGHVGNYKTERKCPTTR